MSTKKRRISWDRIGLITGLIGFLLESLSFVSQAVQGNHVNAAALRIAGIVCILLWALWVTVSVMKLHKGVSDGPSSEKAEHLEGFSIKKVYFDGTDRNFLTEVKFVHGDDSKGTDLEKVDLARATAEGNQIRIQRLHKRFRWIMSVIRYQYTSAAPTDKLIPADLDPDTQGEYARFVYFEFRARVENEPHEIIVVLRNQLGTWLKRGTTEENASRKVRISHRSWDRVEGILGPVRTDQPCYVSLDIVPGPTGDNQCLYLCDLRIIDLREQK